MVEKAIPGIDLVTVDINAQEHKGEAYRAKSPLAKVSALELDDGRVLTEARAICTYLEGLHPEPNLMGVNAEERAFIEMADRAAPSCICWPVLSTPCAIRIQVWRRWSRRSSLDLASRRRKWCVKSRPGLTMCWSARPGCPQTASRLPTSRPLARPARSQRHAGATCLA
jgi:glutathione S-transferase